MTFFSFWDPNWTRLRGLTKLKDQDYLWAQHISWSLVLPPGQNNGTFISPSGAPATSWFCIRFPCGSVLNSLEHLRAALSHDIILRDEDIPQLCKSWDNNITDLVSGIPLKLLVNHEINLIDPKKHIHYQLPKCPQHFCEELSQKIERYTTSQW